LWKAVANVAFGEIDHLTDGTQTSDLLYCRLWTLPIIYCVSKTGHNAKNMSLKEWTDRIHLSSCPTAGCWLAVSDAREKMEGLMSLDEISADAQGRGRVLTLDVSASLFSPAALNSSEAVAWGSDFSNSAQSTLLNSGDTAFSRFMIRLSASLGVLSKTQDSIAAKLLCSLQSTMIETPQALAMRCRTSCLLVKTKTGTV